jgi:hypothetical protein
MAQLSKGTNYTATCDMSFVTHTNLNAHVENAKLIGGAIGEQIPNSVTTNGDELLVKKGDNLFKQTKGQFTSVIDSGTITTVNAIVTNLVAQNCSGFVPVGSIIMWSGDEAAANLIPDNWKLCDGTNGTPDLRDRFIVGAGNDYDIGDIGGTESVTLTATNLPEHSHEFRVRQADQVEIFGSSVISIWDTLPNWGDTGYTQKRLTSPFGSATPEPINTTPRYYAVAYIMRMS